MDLSVLIPARNEQYLAPTIQSVLDNMRAESEVICVLDGAWSDPPIPDDSRVRLIHHSQSIGQRAATNEAARLSQARYIMKIDAHCVVDEGFDVKLIADHEYDTISVPRQYNLHVFDRLCKDCGHRAYQGPTVCEKCQSKNIERVMVWQPRWSRKTDTWRFDSDLHFQYFGELAKRQKGDIIETMSLLGACWFLHREKFWELDGLDEKHGSWGQMGTELAAKIWTSGGRLLTNRKTWFSHAFRTQGGDWGFPYPNNNADKARGYSQDFWRHNRWPKAKRPLSSLVEHFWPVPGWDDAALAALKATESQTPIVKKPLTKGIVYYSDCQIDQNIGQAVRDQIRRSVNGHSIVSVSLKPIQYFGTNIVFEGERSRLTMFKQILAGLEASDADIIFFTEHDCVYPSDHFSFVPPRKDVYYYNQNTWRVNAETGHCLYYTCNQVSGLCAYRELLLQHYRERVRRTEAEGYSRKTGYEPGSRPPPSGIDSFKAEAWMSATPIVDIRHSSNLTKNRWHPSEFRNPKACLDWEESDSVPVWGKIEGRFNEFIADLRA